MVLIDLAPPVQLAAPLPPRKDVCIFSNSAPRANLYVIFRTGPLGSSFC
jgi:hypothetical protein